MTAFTPPVLQMVQPRFGPGDTPLQRRLYKYMRPIDQPVNVFVNSDGTVTTDYSVTIAPTVDNGNATVSTVKVLYPWLATEPPRNPNGPSEGAEGGPWSSPPPPFAWTDSGVTGGQVHTDFVQTVWIQYWFRGGCHYPSISANLVTLLTNAGFAAYLV